MAHYVFHMENSDLDAIVNRAKSVNHFKEKLSESKGKQQSTAEHDHDMISDKAHSDGLKNAFIKTTSHFKCVHLRYRYFETR